MTSVIIYCIPNSCKWMYVSALCPSYCSKINNKQREGQQRADGLWSAFRPDEVALRGRSQLHEKNTSGRQSQRPEDAKLLKCLTKTPRSSETFKAQTHASEMKEHADRQYFQTPPLHFNTNDQTTFFCHKAAIHLSGLHKASGRAVAFI